eukprot:386103_1
MCLSQFNVLNDEIKGKLHSNYHSADESTFTQFATTLRFEKDELLFLKKFIQAKYAKSGCQLCNDSANKKNYDKIDQYFNEKLHNILQHHRETIVAEYKHKSKHKSVKIQFDDISDDLEHLLRNCYRLSECDKGLCAAPRMQIDQGSMFDDDLKAMVLDEDEETADDYQVLINDEDVLSYKGNHFNIEYDFKPFTKYSFQVRKHTSADEWSEYSEPIHVTTEFKCIWSRIHHGNNVRFASNNKYICCKSNGGDCTVICDDKYVMTTAMFKEIAFVFKIEQLAQDSYFGFIDYHLGMDQVEDCNALIHAKEHSYCLSGHHGCYEMDRYVDGKPQGTKSRWTGVWSSSFRLQNKIKIKHGDRFIFVVDFDQMCCNVFVNQVTNELKISTFDRIPSTILPFYAHEHTQYGAAHSKVSISLYKKNGYTYQLR